MRECDIVVVTPEAPDPFGNPAGRWYYVLAKGLSGRGHRVRWLAAYTREASAARTRTYLDHPNLKLTLYPYPAQRWLRRKWSTLLRPYSYFISDRLARDLDTELSKGYDVLHVEHTWTGWLGVHVPRTLLSIQWLAVIDLAGARCTTSYRDRLSRLLMEWTERRIIGQFDDVRSLTPRDSQVIRRLNPRARVYVVPLAIEPRIYPFSVAEPPQPTIGLIGSMRWRPTWSAALRLLTSIWPVVKARMRNAQLLIAGWGACRALASFVNQPDVTILEDLQEAEPYFRQLTLLTYPVVHGSGMKVKVLEAMAYGVPVVTTSEGIEGIDAVNGMHAAVADEDDALIEKIIALLGDWQARREMRLAARRLVEERYSPDPVLSEIERVYERLAR